MATKEQQQELIDTLKFTPRTYKISMWGYGGERVMGTVDPKSWDYCMEHQVDLSDIAWNYEACEEMDLDEDQLPFTPGSWYECDSMAHVNGVSRNAGTLQILDEMDETVFEKSLEDCDGGAPRRAQSCASCSASLMTSSAPPAPLRSPPAHSLRGPSLRRAAN